MSKRIYLAAKVQSIICAYTAHHADTAYTVQELLMIPDIVSSGAESHHVASAVKSLTSVGVLNKIRSFVGRSNYAYQSTRKVEVKSEVKPVEVSPDVIPDVKITALASGSIKVCYKGLCIEIGVEK